MSTELLKFRQHEARHHDRPKGACWVLGALLALSCTEPGDGQNPASSSTPPAPENAMSVPDEGDPTSSAPSSMGLGGAAHLPTGSAPQSPLTPQSGTVGPAPTLAGGAGASGIAPSTSNGGSPPGTGGTSSDGGDTGQAVGGSAGTGDAGASASSGGADAGLSPPMNTAHWVGTWMAAPQLTETSNLPPQPGLAGNTLRQYLLVTIGGSRLRVSLSNEWGNGPVTFEQVHLALAANGSSIDATTDVALTFEGMAAVTVPAGETVTSDALDFELPASARVALSIHFGDVPTDVTGHPGSRTTSYLQAGDAAGAESLPSAVTTDHWYFATGIDVEGTAESAAVVTLGDSITDGRGSTTNGNDRWPNWLARRMQDSASASNIAVLNAGIGGNAVITGGIGPTALERFDRDVLDKSGVRWVIVLEGVNDIGESTASVAQDLIAAYGQLIDRAHARDVLVYGVPILPFAGSFYDSPEHLDDRQVVNEWIRTSGSFDAVLDFDAIVRDPNAPERVASAYDSGDFLHLNPTGYEAMATSVDLDLFSP